MIATCAQHADHPPVPGYCVCVHVLAGHPIARYERAGVETVGLVQCGWCATHGTEVEDLSLMCPACVSLLLLARLPVRGIQ